MNLTWAHVLTLPTLMGDIECSPRSAGWVGSALDVGSLFWGFLPSTPIP